MDIMNWFKKKNYEDVQNLPTIDEISSDIPAISEYLDAFKLPDAFKMAESDTLPVIDVKGKIIGIVSEFDLAKVLPEWSLEEESYRYKVKVGDIMTRDVWAETSETNIKELLSNVHQMHTRVIPIVEKDDKYTGKCITRTALISFLTRMVKPRSIGGLATPIGVYMTDGKHQAGSGNQGLVLTGLALGGIMIGVQLVTGYLFNSIKIPYLLVVFVQFALFLIALRLTPLVRVHAAEHQTIHAIEKGLPLSKETVKMQPRAHKRCGTNIMVLLVGIQLVLILSVEFMRISPAFQFIFLIAGFLVVFSKWRQVGMWLQQNLTTADPSDKQIEDGISTGEELLKKHKEDTSPRPSGFFQKVWNMGIVQILLSFLFILWVFDTILYYL